MTDTTRPFHWGRPNPDYTGPTRAAPSRDNTVVDIADFLSPGDQPEESPADRIAALADDPGDPISLGELRRAGVFDQPDAEPCRAFGQLRDDALSELAEYAAENTLTDADLAGIDTDPAYEEIIRELTEDFLDRNGYLAREYAGLAGDPVAELSRASGVATTAIRAGLATQYARALSARYPSDTTDLYSLASRPARDRTEAVARSAARGALWAQLEIP